MLKKVVSYIFVVIFLFNTMGYFIVFTKRQHDVKTKVRTAINRRSYHDELVAIVIERSELEHIEWIKEGTEMLFNNKRYDVVNVSSGRHAVTFYCIHDKAETALYADLEDHVKSNMSANKPLKSGALKKFLEKQIKLFFPGETIFVPIDFTEKRVPIYTTAEFYHPPQITTPFPPPKCPLLF